MFSLVRPVYQLKHKRRYRELRLFSMMTSEFYRLFKFTWL
nr:MAG TPA: hypothetical protein [Caudoviricetes sp.]